MVGLAVILKPLKKGRGSWQVFYMPEHERTWRLKSHPRFHFLRTKRHWGSHLGDVTPTLAAELE